MENVTIYTDNFPGGTFVQHLPELQSNFANPPNWYRPAPFWFWNHDLQEDEIRRQVRLMHDGGIGGFFMHSRYGRITPYLSEDWHKMIGAAVDEARKFGMHAWLYDEDNWPSGSAGGQTVRENHRFAASNLKPFIEDIVKGPTTLDVKLPQEDEFTIAYAMPVKDGVVTGVPDRVRVFANPGKTEGRFQCKLPAGEWLVLGFMRHFAAAGFNSMPVDTFNKAGIARFIELTHKAYKDRFGDDFGDLIPGIFFGEISMNYGGAHLPWTDDLLEQFEAKMGYDFAKYLPALLYDIGEKTTKYRADFYGFLTWLYCEATVKHIYDFCASCGLRSTGHFNSEHALGPLTREQGNFFSLAKYMQVPGIDHPGDVTWSIAFSAKLASSASHLFGKERTLCESFGLAKSWAISLRDIKRLGDFELACGINLIAPHAFYYSIQGHRKWECIPNHFYQTSFWPYYKQWSDHSARVSLMLSSGRHVADIAVYCPFESMHVNDFTGQSKYKDLSKLEYYEARARRTEKDVQELTQALLTSHHDFDFIDSELLASAVVEDGKLAVKGADGETLESFKCVIVPSATTVPATALQKLTEFAKAGGVVLGAGLLPIESTENGVDAAISDATCELFGIDPIELEAKIIARKDPGTADRYLGAPVSWLKEPALSALDSQIETLIGRDVSITIDGKQAQDMLYYHTSYTDEGEVYFFTNSSPTNSYYEVLVSIPGPGFAVELETQIGYFGLPLKSTEKEGRLEIPLAFRSGQSHMILIRKTEPKKDLKSLPFRRSGRKGRPVEVIELPANWCFRTERGNVLPIKDWKLRMRTGRNAFNFHSLFREYLATFQVKDIPKNARILLDGLTPNDQRCSRVTLVLNGQEITSLKEGRYLDRQIGEADVASLLRKGENEIIIETTSIFEEAESLGDVAYLVGDFALERDGEDQWAAVAPKDKFTGSWHENGYPFYSGIGIYEQEVDLPMVWTSYRWIALEVDGVSDLVEVVVNGKSSGVLAWDPLELDIMPQLKLGKNTITLKVANSMVNLLALEPTQSGLMGKIRLNAYSMR